MHVELILFDLRKRDAAIIKLAKQNHVEADLPGLPLGLVCGSEVIIKRYVVI